MLPDGGVTTHLKLQYRFDGPSFRSTQHSETSKRHSARLIHFGHDEVHTREYTVGILDFLGFLGKPGSSGPSSVTSFHPAVKRGTLEDRFLFPGGLPWENATSISEPQGGGKKGRKRGAEDQHPKSGVMG